MAVERGRTGSGRSEYFHRSPPYREHQYRKPFGARVKDCCRSTIAFMFSNVGVCGLMVGYTIMGAFLFQEIEGPQEEAKHYSVASHRNETIKRLWNITVAFNTLYPKNWTENVDKEIKEYQKYIVEMVGDGWDGTDGTFGPTQWSVEGGFLYSLTVITTIGYGHIVPKTDMGKIVTIFYTIFGMPVFLLYMANMGDILAKSLKWIYSKVCICKKKDNQYDASVVWRSADAILRGPAIPNYVPPELPVQEPEDIYGLQDEQDNNYERTPFESYSGQKGRRERGATRKEYPYDIRRQQYQSREEYERRMSEYNKLRYYEREREAIGERSRPLRSADERPYEVRRERRDSDNSIMEGRIEMAIETPSGSRSEKTDLTAVNIPITVSLVIMIALLYGGTKLFQSYEGWDGLTSFYFCFISLTTIGFGDYVPGSSIESIQSGNKMSFVYCSLYLMFGLALLSMCFNLMQEEVVHKVTSCIKSISISRKKEPN